MLLVQLASMNAFCSKWCLIFDISLYNFFVTQRFFQPPCSSVLWNKCFKRNLRRFILPKNNIFIKFALTSLQPEILCFVLDKPVLYFKIPCCILACNSNTHVLFVIWMFFLYSCPLGKILSSFLLHLLNPAKLTCSKSERKKLEKAVFIVNFEHILHLYLLFLLLTLNK